MSSVQCGPPDPCDSLLQEILEFMANLQKRYWDLRNDVGGLPQTTPSTPDPRYGNRSVEGERHQFRGRQQGLRHRLNEWNTRNCGDPPPGAWEWATREVPAADPKPEVDTKQVVDTTLKVGVGVGAAYLIYRVIRMIPSVAIPPLWPTIPANAAIP